MWTKPCDLAWQFHNGYDMYRQSAATPLRLALRAETQNMNARFWDLRGRGELLARPKLLQRLTSLFRRSAFTTHGAVWRVQKNMAAPVVTKSCVCLLFSSFSPSSFLFYFSSMRNGNSRRLIGFFQPAASLVRDTLLLDNLQKQHITFTHTAAPGGLPSE